MEVKRVFVPEDRRSKSPNSFGTDQLAGLLSDGFPFVSALYLALIERSSGEEIVTLPCRGKEGVFYPDEPVGFVDMDQSPITYGERLIGRLNFPKEVGIVVHSLLLSTAKNRITGCAELSSHPPSHNPNVNIEPLERFLNKDVSPSFQIETHPWMVTEVSDMV